MIGYQAYEPPDAHQRYRQRLYWLRTVPTWQKVAAASLLVLAPMALTMWSPTVPPVLPEAAGAGAFVAAATQSTQWHGVSLGGWLVMEINPAVKKKGDPMDLRPSWMYDQIEANSELDFVLKLRKEHGDAYAIQTMKNHWDGYITDAQLDAAQALGVDTVRLIIPAPAPAPAPALTPTPTPTLTRCASRSATGSWTRQWRAARPSSTASAPRGSSRAGSTTCGTCWPSSRGAAWVHSWTCTRTRATAPASPMASTARRRSRSRPRVTASATSATAGSVAYAT